MRLRELRRLVSIEQVLHRRGLLGGLRRRGDRLVGPCPVHGGDNPNAFVVDGRRGLWNCHTACRGGDVIELIRALDGVSYAEIARTLGAMETARIASADDTSARTCPDDALGQPMSAPTTRAGVFQPYTRRLTLDPEHAFLASRGISPETARCFEVGAWYGHGMLAGCIAVRLHDLGGRPLGYAGRRLQPGDRGKWVLPRGLPKSALLYGWHHMCAATQMVVAEGPWEVLRLHQLGIPAVALLGVHASHEQLRLLRAKRCRVMLDGDSAGRAAAQTLARDLRAPVIRLPPDCDPADLNDQQLIQLLG